MPKNKAVKVVDVAYKAAIATEQINKAIEELEAEGASSITISHFIPGESVILTYVPEGGEGDGTDGEDIPEPDGGDIPDPDNP